MNQKLIIALVVVSLITSSVSLMLQLKSSNYSIKPLQSDASGFDCQRAADLVAVLYDDHENALEAGLNKRAARIWNEIIAFERLMTANNCNMLLE